MVTALLIASTTLLAVSTAVLGWLHTHNRSRIAAAFSIQDEVERLDARVRGMAKDLTETQAHLPIWRTEMESLADRCEDFLDRADRKNKRAAEAEARLTRPKETETDDAAEPDIDELLRGSPAERELARDLLGRGDD